MSVDLTKLPRYVLLYHCVAHTFKCNKCEYSGCTIEYIYGRDQLLLKCTRCKAGETIPSADAIRKAERQKEVIPTEPTVEQLAEAEVDALLAEV